MKYLIAPFKLLLVTLLFITPQLIAGPTTEVVKLICEYHTNPVGMDVVQSRLSWQISATENNFLQTAYEIRVTDNPGKGRLLWSSGKVISDQSVNIPYEGPALKSMQRVYWQVRIWDKQNRVTGWSSPAYWETGILDPALWKASWINMGSEKAVKGSKPCQYLRKDFTIKKKVSSARVYVSSLGLYQLFLNGEKVSNDLFTPGWTSYKTRVQYQAYDVTSLIKPENTIGAIVGDGWYRGNIGWGNDDGYYGNKIALLAQLQINYTDGSSDLVCTDGSWKAANGPILASDIYNGETYDARKEMPGWCTPAFNSSSWENATVFDHPKTMLIAPQGVPVKAIEEIKSVKIFTTPKGETVFDLGQNMVGWVRLKVQGKAGDRVTLRFAEVLDKEGNFYTDNLRAAKATDVYICKGNGTEIFEPHFTFHGFRYVAVEGLNNPAPDQITGIVIHSDMEPTGTFSCSDSLINQLQHNIRWGQKGNFLDVPTDCPQRDERLG